MIKIKRGLSLLLCVSMVAGMLIGCGDKDKDEESNVINYEGKPNVTASSETKWINSDIYGAIDNTLTISEKDDFHTAVNKEWLLQQTKPTEDDDDRGLLLEGDEIVKDRLIGIVSGKEDKEAFDGSQVDISDEEIAHDQELVVRFVKAAADWDARNKASVEPLRAGIEDIMSISSIDDMTDFIVDFGGRNLSGESLVDIQTYAGSIDAENYRCIVAPDNMYSLNNAGAYTNMSLSDKDEFHLTNDVIEDVLGKLGYDSKTAKDILTKCYRFEGMLVDHTNQIVAGDPEAYSVGHTVDEIEKLSGKYPFEKVYNAYGYTITDDIRLADKAYFKYLGSVYNDSNLELIKSYFIVHAISNNILFLDRAYYDKITEQRNRYTKNHSQKDEGKGDVKENENKDEWDLILNEYAMKYIAGPLNVVYISRYLSQDEKNKLVEIIEEIIYNYHDIIESEDWMSLSAKEATHEKLDCMTIRVLYPEKMTSYMDLEFDDSDSLITMIQKLSLFNRRNLAIRANTPVDKEMWNLSDAPTTVVNAFYRPDDNSINILGGIIAGENVFNINNSEEQNLARIGTVIGHEISHAFDSTGCHYDKNGYRKSWWDISDLTTFEVRVAKLSNYYNAITPYPGAKDLLGSRLSGEAIADMGGMKAILMVVRNRENFNYDEFFRSYAQLWRMSRSLGKEMLYAEMDEHPLSYLRTNVTLMQFDEFIETYDIKEGDGMYCAPENRIKVW